MDNPEFSLRNIVQCEPIFMDSGAFASACLGFTLDPFEVAEIHSRLKADLIVPLDDIIFSEDNETMINQKVATTILNTEILIDLKPKESEIVGPLQGLSLDVIERLFDAYRSLGIRKFALGGLVFQSSLKQTIEHIKRVRKLTNGFFLHVFGRFLHPALLKPIMKAKADSVDGFGYILKSVKGMYIEQKTRKYVAIGALESVEECPCSVCIDNDILDFQRGDEAAQYLLIRHNIAALIDIKNQSLSELN
ncbi:MAG: hypothetical protein ACFFE8_06825 [Candidatus Heimdallarchaeota archaeon]